MKSLVVTFILIFCSVFVAYAQVVGGGSITQKGKNGESYKVELYGDLIFGSERLPGGAKRLGSAMMQGKGQYVLAEEMILVSSEKVTGISDGILSIQIDGKTIEFILSKTTKICDGSKVLKASDIKIGDMVTITFRIDRHTALSVRKGPMLFGLGGFVRTLKKYRCEE